jgi:dihydrofolate reductase
MVSMVRVKKIPWYIPQDLKNFKELTTNQAVIMGRGTWESLPDIYRPLPKRTNMVITNTPDYVARGATIFPNIDQAIASSITEKVFCIGGVDIWYHAMSRADEAFITIVGKEYLITEGVTHCAPNLLNLSKSWRDFKLERTLVQPKLLSEHEQRIVPFKIEHWVRKVL